MRTVTALRCHFWVLLSVILDAGGAALIVTTYKHDILLPYPKNNVDKNLQNFLPTFAALIGGLIAYANNNAVTALVTIHARRKMARTGITFRQLSYYDQLGEPCYPTRYRVFSDADIRNHSSG